MELWGWPCSRHMRNIRQCEYGTYKATWWAAVSKREVGRVKPSAKKIKSYDGPWPARAGNGKVRGDSVAAKSHRRRALGSGLSQIGAYARWPVDVACILIAVLERYFTSSHRPALFAFR